MKLTKAAPIRTGFPREFERLVERVFGPRFELPELPMTETEWAPSLDLTETNKDFIVRLEAPGIHKENLDLGLEGNVLTVSGRREFRKEHESEEFIWREREEGRFVRSVRLPKAVDPDKVHALYQDGLLTIRLPKSEPAVKSKITIK